MKKTAVVLTSGGIDSTTCMALAVDQGFEIVALSFDYGQRHAIELDAARRVAHHYRASKHLVFEVGVFRTIGGSSLTDDIDVPKDRSSAEMSSGIPSTYVPARNLVFLSYAVGVAETHGSNDIFVGVNALDFTGYPDCRPEFIESFTQTARVATRVGVNGQDGLKIHTPLIQLTKAQIIEAGTSLGAPYHLTHSCYCPSAAGAACGRCDSCILRLRGFEEVGLVDTVQYVKATQVIHGIQR